MKKTFLAILCLFVTIPAYARTITIKPDGTGDYPTIQAAIDDANDGDVIILNPGTYTGDGNRDIRFFGKAITVRSTDPNDPNTVAATIINCEGSEISKHRGFSLLSDDGPDSIIAGLTITNGYSSSGGAICGRASKTSIKNCIIRNNYAKHSGGGIYYCDGIISNCTISSNKADGTATFSGGGGINLCSGNIINCIISGNRTKSLGGAINNCRGPIVNCVIVGNEAERGGALGQCINLISNCIIWDNRSSNSILEQSSIPLYSCIQFDANGTGCISSDPCFVIPGYWDGNFWVEGDYHIMHNSPCVDRGRFSYFMNLPSTDLDGNTRLMDSQIDMGCYETNSKPDLDGDWLPDIYEANHSKNPDRDNDGIFDGVELLRGTDPDAFDILNQINVPNDVNSIQDALFFSRSGEKIILKEGVYYDNIYIGGKNITLTSTKPSNSNIVLRTVINGNSDSNFQTPNGRVIYFMGTESKDCTIRGLTIKEGYCNSSGGGIYGAGCHANIDSCFIIDNTTKENGGGIYEFYGSINNCLICDNVAYYGGGLSNCSGLVNNCTIKGNSGFDGGGMYRCSGNISNCEISDNIASRKGGGLSDCNGKITNCIIKANIASKSNGGGIFCQNGNRPTINNCLVSDNSAYLEGGGISCWVNSRPVIKNCTIVNNFAGKLGGGISCGYRSTVTVSNCIVYFNKSFQIYGSGSKIITYCNVEGGQPGTGNIYSNPCFIEPGADNYRLLFNSPCINAGKPNYVPEPNETDLDGKSRVVGGRIDMGAYEFNPNTPPVADAGPDQTAYAWIDGIAEVNLDGSASYDDDGDELTYLWSWQIGSDIYEANGVNPVIELPVGQHTIELIVNDGIEDSEPNYTTITVIEPLEAKLWIMPRVINRKSRGRHLIAWLQLPPLITEDDIDNDYPLTMYPGEIEASRQFIFTNMRKGLYCTNILAFFDRRDLLDAAEDNGRIWLDITGKLTTGQYFYAQRRVLITNRPNHH